MRLIVFSSVPLSIVFEQQLLLIIPVSVLLFLSVVAGFLSIFLPVVFLDWLLFPVFWQ